MLASPCLRLTRRHSPDLRCAVCHGDLRAGALRCGSCGTDAHVECSTELGRCPTLGCEGRATRAWRDWLGIAIAVSAFVVGPLLALVASAPRPEIVRDRGPVALTANLTTDDLKSVARLLGCLGESSYMHEDLQRVDMPKEYRAVLQRLGATYVNVERRGVTVQTVSGRWLYVFDERPPFFRDDAPLKRVAEGVWEYQLPWTPVDLAPEPLPGGWGDRRTPNVSSESHR